MKISELIKELQEYDPNQVVYVFSDWDYEPVRETRSGVISTQKDSNGVIIE